MARRVIVYVGSFELPDKNGAAHRVLANAKILDKLGFTVVIVGVRKDQAEEMSTNECHGFTTYSLQYPSSGVEWLKRYFMVGQYLRILNEIPRNQLKAIVFYNEKSFLQYRVRAWARNRNIKIIADVTEWYAHSGWGPVSIFKKLDAAVRMHLLNRTVDGLITTSVYITNYYAARGFPREKIVELPTLFDSDLAAARIGTERAMRSGALLSLVYCGHPFNLNKAKVRAGDMKERLDQAIDVFLRIKELRPAATLAIYGVTAEQFLRFYPEYRLRTEMCGVSLRFHGNVANNIALKAVANSDFSIFFRDHNRVTLSGFPTKFAEAITYGTPIITNQLSSIQKYAVPGQNCYIVDPALQTDDALVACASLDEEEIAEMKRACFESKLFDYRNYTRAVGSFAAIVGI